MRPMDLEQVIQELGDIEIRIRLILYEVYGCCFAGPIKIIPLKTSGYLILIGTPFLERPISFAAELTGEDFFKYMRLVLIEASLHSIKKYSIQLEIVDLFPITGYNNVFKVNIPRNDFGGDLKTIAPIIPNAIKNLTPEQKPKPKPTPVIIHNTSSQSTQSSIPDWYGTQEEFDRIKNVNPNISYYIYEEVD